MRLRPVVRLISLIAAGGLLAGCGTREEPDVPPVERVLIVSLPGVRWADLLENDLKNLEAFVETAAIGDLSTRIGRRPASTTDAYLSIGAGTRALAPDVDFAVAVDPDELYGGVPTEDILKRRLGRVPRGIAYLAVGAAIERNAESLFGAKPGRLGDLLSSAGIHRAVIANADAAEGFVSDEPPPDGAYARGAATALMGSDGIVPGGTVGRGLLQEDPAAPFGRRLDHDAVLKAFDAEWQGNRPEVVLVEASDLSRAAAYSGRSTPMQQKALRERALADSDDLLGELISRTDPQRDAVLVVSPVAATFTPELAIAAMRAPGRAKGLLRSSTTRRDGYVQLADVGPTVLDLVGLEQPEEIEGRAFDVGSADRSGRVERLVNAAEDAAFRDALMYKVVPAYFGVQVLLLLGVALASRLPAQVRRLLTPGALIALSVIPGTYLVGRLGLVRGNTLAYFAAVMLVALPLAAAGLAIDRRRPGFGPIAVLAAITGMFTFDVVLGAPLQLNSVFGYSVAVAGRFSGLGNLAFALFGASAVLLASLLVERYGPAGLKPALALLLVVVLVEGLPMLGADVGGVLSMVPAFGVTALLLAGRRPRWTHYAALGAAAVGSVLVFAFLDAARPEGSRTHLARVAQHVLDGRWELFFDSLGRRLQASFGSAELAAWAALLVLAVGAGVYTIMVARGLAGPGVAHRDRDSWQVAAITGVAVLAVIGLVANDSSVAVPAAMVPVLVPVFVLRRAQPR
ncbi:membrane protein [soil metagenome]